MTVETTKLTHCSPFCVRVALEVKVENSNFLTHSWNAKEDWLMQTPVVKRLATAFVKPRIKRAVLDCVVVLLNLVIVQLKLL